jgi:hypothetical protein
MRLQVLAAALFLSLATSLDANEPLSMAVSPLQSFAPTNLTIRLRVAPDDANRALEVVAESGEYYRSSSIELDGSEAPRTISFEFRDVPGGNYDVRGTLISSGGKARAAVRQHVIVIDQGSLEREPERTNRGVIRGDRVGAGQRSAKRSRRPRASRRSGVSKPSSNRS